MLNYLAIDWGWLFQKLFWPGCIILAAFIIGLILNNLINRRIRKHLDLDEDSLQYVFIHALRGVPISWCLGVGIYWAIGIIEFSPGLTKLLSYLLFTVIIYTITRVAARTVSGMIDIHTNRDPDLPKTSLLTNIVNIVIYAMGVLVILQYYGISIAPIITALGVGGMAVALGLQETLANIFSGLHLILSKQLRIGDYVKLTSGEEGKVSDITWRFTTLISLLGNAIVIPNQKIASSIITNYDMPHRDITVKVAVGVAYDSDLDQVEKITLDVARTTMEKVDHTIAAAPSVRFHTFGESSIDFNVFLHSSQFESQSLLKHEFIKALTRRYRQEKIEIPYPIRTVYNGPSSANL